ncbi:hypothetical protein [Polyangium mundeleinium]|uniref:Uncharacterized protein n=1 Tax=Polyangium mundeleinium TaxID=2995306 RepID=A0ABT5EJK8_9BACT|nr:hypothetical protein [Polyangium mundeleinium]MDC0740921.1 hypothetical protein [Polyangium mundeleinium]
MTKDKETEGNASNRISDAGSREELVASFGAGYALQHLFDSIDGIRQAMDEGDVRFEQDIKACAVAAQYITEWFREKRVAFDDDLQPIAPATTLELSRLKTLHAEAMHMALDAIHGAAEVTEGIWSDPDFLPAIVNDMNIEAFGAGPPNRLWVGDRKTGQKVELVREVCARLASTGLLVDLEGFPASPFPRNPFPGIKGPSNKQ